jgi:hypothetical protein
MVRTGSKVCGPHQPPEYEGKADQDDLKDSPVICRVRVKQSLIKVAEDHEHQKQHRRERRNVYGPSSNPYGRR